MRKGWVDMTEVSEEQLEARRQEAIAEYSNKIGALKEEEASLKEIISNLKSVIEKAHADKIRDLNTQESELKQKLSEAQSKEIEANGLIVTANNKLADLEEKKAALDALCAEKEEEFSKTNAEIEAQKDEISKAIESNMNKETEINQRISDHDKNVNFLNEQIGTVAAKNSAVDALRAKLESELLAAKTSKADYVAALQETINIKSEYKKKYDDLDGERAEIATIKAEYCEKTERFNKEKEAQNNLAIQLKLDRVALEKSTAELNERQRNLTSQMEKLEALQKQLNASMPS